MKPNKAHIDIALLSIGEVVQCGIYDNGTKIDTITSNDLTLVALPKIFENILERYSVRCIYYARGPGSFTALKLTHIFCHTLSLVHNITLKATSSFYFTNSDYIKAFGNTYFARNGDDIKLATLQSQAPKPIFTLPEVLDPSHFSHPPEPLYILPAV